MQELALQVNRPHGWAFQNITNGEIKDMKLWQVSLMKTVCAVEVLRIFRRQPVAWSFSTSGSKDLHVHHNKITAISENEVRWLTHHLGALDSELSG